MNNISNSAIAKIENEEQNQKQNSCLIFLEVHIISLLDTHAQQLNTGL